MSKMFGANAAQHGPAGLTTISMLLLVGMEVFAVAISGAWAVAGLFELGDTISYVLMLLFSALGAWLMLQLWRRTAVVDPNK